MRLFDTAGLRRKARISEKAEKLSASDAVRAIRFAEVVVLLIDAERPFEHQDLTIGDLVARRAARWSWPSTSGTWSRTSRRS